MKTLVLIPAKNESAKIAEVVGAVVSFGWPVVVVDDGSTDDTASLARDVGAIVLRHAINRGQGAALKTGIAYALEHDYQAVVFFDADGQMQASEISRILEPLENGQAEVALGSRFLGQVKNIGLAKLITLKLGLAFTRLSTGLKLTDAHNGFQAWKSSALKKINLTQDRQAYASELLQEIARCRLTYREVPVTISYTAYSRSKGQSVFNAFGIVWDLIIKK